MPALSVARVSSVQEITFVGVNLQSGDAAKWVSSSADSCDSANDATPISPVAAGGKASFSLGGDVQQLQLCYKFRYATSGGAATSFLLFPSIKLSLMRVDTATPAATAVGCSSVITILGAGFLATPSLAPACTLGSSGVGTAVVVSDTLVRCTTPAPATTGTVALRLDFGGVTASNPAVVSNFAIYDAASITLSSIYPAGGGYNLKTSVFLTGSFVNYGAPRCRFGDWEGAAGTVTNATYLTCGKPSFPDSARNSLGEYLVTVAANGQCFSAASVSFRTYNSQVNSIGTSGAPASSSVTLAITGEGFVTPTLPGAVCSFQRGSSGATTTKRTAFTALSQTSASCPTPADGAVGTWFLSVLQVAAK